MKITVHAKPNSREEKVESSGGDSFVVSVKEPPKEGRANSAVLKAVAKYFKVPVSLVRIISGKTSKLKIIEVKNGK